MLFWAVAAILTLAVAAYVLRPMLRKSGDAGRAAAYDMQIYKDQLQEIEADLARGVLSPTEAEASRTEVSRRLLAAADAAESEGTGGPAPRSATQIAVGGTVALVIAGTLGGYVILGAPGMSDQPLVNRMGEIQQARLDRPSQEEAEAMIAAENLPPPTIPDTAEIAEYRRLVPQLEQVLLERPNDVTGHRLLAQAYLQLGRVTEARMVQDRVMNLLGNTATATDYAEAAEIRIIAANGYVSPEAERALAEGLQRNPGDPVLRYYSGLTLAQNNSPELALRIWAALLEEGPPEAPWVQSIQSQIGGLAAAVELQRIQNGGAPALRGPDQETIDAARDLSPQDQIEMIEGMVAGLSNRLATEGGTPAEWAQLVRALTVLGEIERRDAVLAEARTVFAANPDAVAAIEAAAQ
nr:c-type cytochrome biogenesis protein CcmI [Rubricella aquisinus]